MSMRAFEYARPKSLDEAFRLLRGDDSVLLAGGSDLLALLKDDLVPASRVVSLGSIPSFADVAVESDDDGPDTLRLGAGATMAQLSEDETVRERAPALAAACAEVGGPQVREAATLGGNLCQWPRCWYFRTGLGLLAEHDGRSLVREGENRYHAIFHGDGPALYVHPSTVAPLLVGLRARVRVAGPRGVREVPVEDFLVVAKREGERTVALRPREIVTDVLVPLGGRRRAGFHEVRQKAAMDWPLVTATVVFREGEGVVREPRVVLGHVAPVPHRARKAETALDGSAPGEKVLKDAGRAATDGAEPLSQNAYKLRLVRVAVRRAVEDALAREVVS